MEQIPIIGTQRKLQRKIKCLCENGFLERELLYEKNGIRGKFSYVNITSKLDELNEYIPYDKMSQGLRQNSVRVTTECRNKDTPISEAVTNRYKSLICRIDEYGIDKVLKAIKNINNSSFLKGQNKNNWTIYFDWLVKPNNFIKVLEGNYADEKGVNGNDFCSTRQNFSQCGKKEIKYDYSKITGI